MKLGIKCEIHDCTIALVKFLEDFGIFEKNTYKILEEDKELRIDNQYYLKNKPVNIDFDELSIFLLSIRKSLDNLNSNKIKEIRDKIMNL